MNNIRVYLLAYPDNPAGKIFLKIFLNNHVPLSGVIVEKKNNKHNWNRFIKKIKKDGFSATINRLFQVIISKLSRRDIVRLAERHGIDVYWVNNFNSQECANLLAVLDVDILAIASAPILKDYIFKKAKKGCLNPHPGWLPTYRGLGANAYAIQNGDAPGVTVHFIDAGIDTGNIIVREKIQIRPRDTIAKINDRAMARGAELMADVIHKIEKEQLIMPEINEVIGKLYRAMPYSLVKKVNKNLRMEHAF